MFLLLLLALLAPAESRIALREVQRLDSIEGRLFLDIEGIAFLPDGSWFIADKLAYRVLHVNSRGGLVGEVGGRGTADGLFRGPGAVTASRNAVAVVDFATNRVQVFSLALTHRRTITMPGPVFDLHYGSGGLLWVAGHSDHVTAALVALDTAGREVRHITPRGATGDLFADVFRFDIGPEGNLYLVYMTQNLVEVWDQEGRFLRSFSIPGLPQHAPTKLMKTPWSPQPIPVPEENFFRAVAVTHEGSVLLLGDGLASPPRQVLYLCTPDGQSGYTMTLPQPATGIWCDAHGTVLTAGAKRNSLIRYQLSTGR